MSSGSSRSQDGTWPTGGREASMPLDGIVGICWHRHMRSSVPLTRRSYIDLLRVCSAACRGC
jgi:hypothetical protein